MNITVALLVAFGIVYATVVEMLARRRPAAAIAYATSVVDFVLISIGVVIPPLVVGSIADATKTPATLLYFPLIAFASLRLRPALPLVVGAGATLVTIGLFILALLQEPERVDIARYVDWNSPEVGGVRVLILVAMIITAAALGAQSAGQPRRALERSLRTLTFLFADLRGFSEFVERRGDQAAAALIREYRDLVRSAIRRTGGREMKTEGDSFLVEFRTSQQALECARRVMTEAERHTGARPELPLRIGIGIHAGEPVREDGDYIGSAVNIAARLGQVAGPGEILISDVVRGLLRTSGLPPTTERTGLILKGISEPPRIYAVEWSE